MKKTGLFKIIMFMLLGIVVATWIFSASFFTEGNLSDLGMYSVGFFDFFSLVFGSFEFTYFLQIFILLVSIGALYGVLGKTGKYRAWVEKIANKCKGTEIVFLIIAAFVIAALTSVFDYGFCLFIFFPFIISIILAMGYDKVTAAVTTFGAMLVGSIGSTLGKNNSGVIADLLSIKPSAAMLYKLALFIFSFAVLVLYLSKARKLKLEKRDDKADLFIGEKVSNKYSIVPIVVIFSLIFVFLVLGCTSWSDIFGVDVFTKFHEKVTALTIKLPYIHITPTGIDTGSNDVAILAKIFGTFQELGKWHYAEMSIICLIASLLIGLFYRVKGKFDAMLDGAKKMLKPALMVLFAYTVIYFAGNQMFYPTIAALILSISSKFSVILSAICVAIGSVFHIDMLYVANYVLPQIAAIEGTNSTVLALVTQSIYGVTMFVAPTSAVLVFGLTYLGIPYKEWIKKTWKLVVTLLVVVLVILLLAKFL